LSEQPTTPEFSLVLETLLQTYEALTGLTVQHMSRDAHSRWIDWAYADGTWAGTTSYDRPLSKMIEKLERQIEDEYQRLGVDYTTTDQTSIAMQLLSTHSEQLPAYAVSN
jgi:hypothetical protein